MEYNIEEILEMYEDDFNPDPRPMAQEPRNMAEGGRMLNPVQMGEDLGYRTGFRKPIYVPTKKSYVVNDRKNKLIEDFKIEDYGSKSKAKKAADALDKKISAENEKRRIETSKKNRADFSNKRIDFKKSINTWTQNWMDNNIGIYDLQDADTFIKDMKEDFAKDFNIEAPSKNTAASIDGFPNIGSDAKGGKAAFTPYGIDSIKKPGKSKGGSSYYDSFFRRAFLTNKIQTDDVLKNRISNYLDYATLNKPGGGPALDKLKLKYADTLNNLDDVMYVLSDDTQVVNLAKKNLLSNIFPQYNKFKAKQNSSAISRKNNIAKIEKTLGPAKLKELLNGGTSIDKFLVDEGKTLKEFFPSMKELPLGLRYSVDHNIGIAELAKLSKSDMEKGLNSLIGMSNKRNYDLGWKGYSVIKKNLINKIQQGVDVSDNLNKLNEITQTAYGSELKGKKAYDLVNDKLTFTEDFTFRTNPEERFKSYFREINKTPEGGAAIKKDFGSMNNLTKKIMKTIKEANPELAKKVEVRLNGGLPLDDIMSELKKIPGLEKTAKGLTKGFMKVGGPFEVGFVGLDMFNELSKGKTGKQAFKTAVSNVTFGAYEGGKREDMRTLLETAKNLNIDSTGFSELKELMDLEKNLLTEKGNLQKTFQYGMDERSVEKYKNMVDKLQNEFDSKSIALQGKLDVNSLVDNYTKTTKSLAEQQFEKSKDSKSKQVYPEMGSMGSEFMTTIMNPIQSFLPQNLMETTKVTRPYVRALRKIPAIGSFFDPTSDAAILSATSQADRNERVEEAKPNIISESQSINYANGGIANLMKKYYD